MMKKIIIISSIALSAFSFAQESDNSFVYESTEQTEEENNFPGNPGDPEPAAIDGYTSFLVIVAIGLVIIYVKRNRFAE